MKILGLVNNPINGVDYHRVINPINYLPLKNEGDGGLIVNTSKILYKSVFKDISIVLYTRNSAYDIEQLIKFRKEFGFKLVVDIDDYWHLPQNHTLYKYWMDFKMSDAITYAISKSDLVTTTNAYLRDKIYPLNKKVEIIPNALPYGEKQFNSEKLDTKNILYSANITHLEDLKGISFFLEMCKNNGDIQKYAFCLAGISNNNQGFNKIFQEMQKESSKFGNYKIWPYLKLENYMEHYKHARISIAPLLNNEFNKCKSNLKALEAGCKGIPLLCSDVGPYRDLPAIHCKSNKDWYNNLKDLVRNPDKIDKAGSELEEYVKTNYNLKTINDKRKTIYENI